MYAIVFAHVCVSIVYLNLCIEKISCSVQSGKVIGVNAFGTFIVAASIFGDEIAQITLVGSVWKLFART
jgi:multidrug transporter EmrE-like cation transporter